MDGVAFLSNDNNYTIFKYKDHIIRFLAPYSLERYAEVKEWDNGYLVVMTQYKHSNELVEEYIDLLPILDNLYFDTSEFLGSIKRVGICQQHIEFMPNMEQNNWAKSLASFCA